MLWPRRERQLLIAGELALARGNVGYILQELRDFHLQVAAEPEVVREERTALLAAMTAAN